MYEFVSKKEYSPIRKEIEGIIKNTQKILKKEDSDLTFQFRLIGSGGRNLITKIKGGNKGYDFDYNLLLNPNFSWKSSVREDFFNALKESIKGTRFNKIENSTSVITIKQVIKNKVIVGCDFSVIYYPDDIEDCEYYKYSRLNKNTNKYTWEIRSVSKYNNEKLEYLEENYSNIWNDIREEYLKLKDHNRQNKHSFILYHEAINNIYNQITQEEKEESNRYTL